MNETAFGIIVRDYSRQARGTLRGYVDVELAGGLILLNLAVHTNPDRTRWWVLHVGRPILGRDGALVREGGAISYERMIDFTSRTERWAFSRRVIDALRDAYPEIFQ